MTSPLPMQPDDWKTLPSATRESLSMEDFLRALEVLEKANDRFLREANTITYTPTGDGGFAPRIGPSRN